MKQRIITGIILIIVALLWLFAPFEIFTIGSFIVLLLGGYEFAQLSLCRLPENANEAMKPVSFLSKIVYAMSTCIIAAFIYVVVKGIWQQDLLTIMQGMLKNGESVAVTSILSPNHPMYILGLTMVIGCVWWLASIVLLARYPCSINCLRSIPVRSICGYLTLIPFFFALLFLRVQYGDSTEGTYLILSVMVLVWCTDSGAYFTGKKFGKNKMSPAISPNKTFEGLLGGILTAMLGFVILAAVGAYGSHYSDHNIALAITAFCTIIISVIGDLVESMFKRIAQIKDSGKIFPGHGGMLDRIDSLAASLPVFVVVYALTSNM